MTKWTTNTRTHQRKVRRKGGAVRLVTVKGHLNRIRKPRRKKS
jgi:hypothetical protein